MERRTRRRKSPRTRRQRNTEAPLEPFGEGEPFALSGPLAQLPSAHVGETVVSFLALPPAFAVRFPDGLDAQSYEKGLVPLRLVCRYWNRLVLSLVTAYKSQRHCVEFTNTNDGTSLPAESPHAIELQCIAQYPARHSVPLMVPRSALPPDRLSRIRWKPVFSAFSQVVRLDLLMVCLSLIDKVLDAASTSCPSVQFLVLPHKTSAWSGPLLTSDKLTPHLVDALRVWHQSNGGLCGLAIPQWPSEPNGQYNELFSAVATYCPRLEYLHGWHKKNPSGPLNATRLGLVLGHVWEAFCKNCTQLREFSWRLAPLSCAFVQQFRLTPKPMLTDLRIDDINFTEAPADILKLQSLFSATPALVSLSLWMPNYRNASTGQANAKKGSLDAIVASIVRNCPYLESFRCFLPRSLEIAAVATGDSLVSLIQQIFVREVVVSPVVLSRHSVVNMLEAIIASKRQRFCTVELFPVGSAHDAIHELLQFLEREDQVKLTRLRFQLCAKCPDGDATDHTTALVSQDDVAAQVARIKAKHAPSITRLEVSTRKLKGQHRGVYAQVEVSINANHK